MPTDRRSRRGDRIKILWWDGFGLCLFYKRLENGRFSEVLDEQIQQLELTLEEPKAQRASAVIEPVMADAAAKPVRRPLPEHLPRESIVHPALAGGAACGCPDCGGLMRALGKDVSEVLEYLPSRLKVIRHVRPKLSCASCQKIVQAPASPRPIERVSQVLRC